MRIPISTKFFELQRSILIQLIITDITFIYYYITFDIRYRILIQNNKNIPETLTDMR